MPLDSTYEFETPEGVTLELRLAGLLPRMLAWVLDTVIRLGIFLLFSFVTSFFDVAGFGILLIIWFLLEWFYPVLFEVYTGATPGKRALQLYVCHDDGTPVSWGGALTRNLLRVVDFAPFFYTLGGLVVMFGTDFKRIGDHIAGTVVVYKDPDPIAFKGSAVQPQAIPILLSLQEQRAVLDFSERASQLSTARKEELASHLAGVMNWPKISDDDYYTGLYTQKMLAYANTIASGRSVEADASHPNPDKPDASQVESSNALSREDELNRGEAGL